MKFHEQVRKSGQNRIVRSQDFSAAQTSAAVIISFYDSVADKDAKDTVFIVPW